MFSPLFWFFAALTLLFGIGVVVNRNPVASALSLVISFMGLAALFVGLDAYLIAVLQVLVYAGAVMVLFLFIIMLLDLRAEKRRNFNWLGIGGGGLVALGFAGQLVFVLMHHPGGDQTFPAVPAPVAWESSQKAYEAEILRRGMGNFDRLQADIDNINSSSHPSAKTAPARPEALRPVDDVQQIGAAIFTKYNLPLQIVGVLILVATVGVVVLSRKELK